jgi:sodium-dependent phosphate transporter
MYTWILCSTAVFSFLAAYGVGSNDVANSFATAVGSKALSLGKAVAIASVCEFTGAFFMGSQVTKTIRKGIADYECFQEQPELLMYGSMCVAASVAAWLYTATRFSLPVSTTHSVVGGIIGMTLVAGDNDCVVWYKKTPDFPYVGGVFGILASWLISPILSGIASTTLFMVLRTVCLRHANSFDRIWLAFPVLIGSTVVINTFFILWKGLKNMSSDIEEWSLEKVFGISFITGLSSFLLSIPLSMYLKNRTRAPPEELDNPDTPKEILENTEKFDPQSEEGLKYLQVFTSMCDSFAHGANDVANAVGPLSTVYMIYETGEVAKKYNMGENSFWILGLGGLGIVLGLSTYGKNMIETLGLKISKITPSRGICIELGAAIVIIIGSRYGWPLSTTHCQLGATTAVALLEGKKGLNWNIFRNSCLACVATLGVVGSLSALLTAQGIYSPEKDL